LVYQAVNHFDRGEIVMKKNSRILAYSATGLIILLLLFAWFQANNNNAGTADNAMLLDESVTPAPYALIRLQEQPVFQIDDTGKPFATIDDLDDAVTKS
jgi:hypothetical protein